MSDEATAQWLRWRRALRLAEPSVGLGPPGGALGFFMGKMMVFPWGEWRFPWEKYGKMIGGIICGRNL